MKDRFLADSRQEIDGPPEKLLSGCRFAFIFQEYYGTAIALPPGMPQIYSVFIAALLCVSGWSTAASNELLMLRELTMEHPYCEDRVELAVGKEFFVEIANELKGTASYNELVRAYHRANWSGFDSAYLDFRKNFPSSPLREAATFLKVQTMFERASSTEQSLQAEQGLRKAILLYPRSDWVPVLYATAGSFMLTHNQLDRSLAFYERGYRDFPKTPLKCIFKLGIGETKMLSGNRKESKEAFQWVADNCRNPTLRNGARLRLIDLRLRSAENKKGLEDEYDTIISEGQNIIFRLYHGVFHNIAEIKYRNGKYVDALYYFKEYLKHEDAGKCRAYALKRIADIKFKQSSNVREIVEKYLEASEKAKATEPGRFSLLHALLLDSTSKSESEFNRRVRVFDEEIKEIRDPSFREFLFVEKGLATLVRGDLRGFGYLRRISDRTGYDLRKGLVAQFIRMQLLKALEKQTRSVSLQKAEEPQVKDIHMAYDYWLKGTAYESKAKKLVTKIVLSSFADAIKSSVAHAFDILFRGMESDLWSPLTLDNNTRAEFIDALLQPLETQPDPERIAVDYVKYRSKLDPVLGKHQKLFWLIVKHEAKADLGDINSKGVPRDVASLAGAKVEKPTVTYLYRKGAEILAGEGNPKAALALLKKIPKGYRNLASRKLSYELHQQQKNYKDAFSIGLTLAGEAEQEAQADYFRQLVLMVKQGSLWNRADELLTFAKKKALPDSLRTQALYLSGIAHFERNNCRRATGYFSEAVLSPNPVQLSMEGQFKFGKCLLKQGKKSQALKWWASVAQSSDSFWAPLASTQLALHK